MAQDVSRANWSNSWVLTPTVLLRTNSYIDFLCTWCYPKPSCSVFQHCKVSTPTHEHNVSANLHVVPAGSGSSDYVALVMSQVTPPLKGNKFTTYSKIVKDVFATSVYNAVNCTHWFPISWSCSNRNVCTLTNNLLLSKTKQETSQRRYVWYGILAGNLILVSKRDLCFATCQASAALTGPSK